MSIQDELPHSISKITEQEAIDLVIELISKDKRSLFISFDKQNEPVIKAFNLDKADTKQLIFSTLKKVIIDGSYYYEYDKIS